MNSKELNLNIRPEILKLIEENVSESSLTGLGDKFFKSTTKPKASKAKINKWDYIK